MNTVYTLCGPDLASEILLGSDSEFVWTWRMFSSQVLGPQLSVILLGLAVGLPLVPFVLIASRTRAFDSIFPVLPVMFFCHRDPLHFTIPPSPSISLALLPYVRAAYDGLWRRYIAPYEMQWLKDITPTFALQNAEEQRQQQQQRQQRQQQRRVENGNRRRNRRGVNANLNPNQAPDEAADAIEPADAVDWDGEVRLQNHNIFVQGSNITTMVLGALLWPSMAKAVGCNILGRWPAAWGGERLRRWFPSQLVRNIVGGLIIVVVKVHLQFPEIYYLRPNLANYLLGFHISLL